jgi:FixJ family two-component response regulator
MPVALALAGTRTQDERDREDARLAELTEALQAYTQDVRDRAEATLAWIAALSDEERELLHERLQPKVAQAQIAVDMAWKDVAVELQRLSRTLAVDQMRQGLRAQVRPATVTRPLARARTSRAVRRVRRLASRGSPSREPDPPKLGAALPVGGVV